MQDQATYGPLDLTGSLRYTRLRFRELEQGSDRTFNRLSPQIGATLDIVPGVTVYAAYATAFRGAFSIVSATTPKPETSRNVEGGVKLAMAKAHLSGTIAVFDQTRRNVATPDPNDIYFSIQIGDQRARGAEADLTWELTPAFSLLATYAYTDAAPAGTATVASVPVTANGVVADGATHPTPPVAGGGGGGTLCKAGETPFFSCEIGAMRVSVCGSGAGAVYRYGSLGKVELTSRSLTFANRAYSGGGESQITAKNGDYTYTVYDSTVRTSFGDGGNDPEFSSGLVVSRGERKISSKMCKAVSSIDAAAEQSMPAGSFAEH